MASTDRYRVVLGGKVLPEHEYQAVLTALARLFNSNRRRMQSLLQGREVPLRKRYDEQEATAICAAVRAAGLVCRVEQVTPPASAVESQQNTAAPEPAAVSSDEPDELDEPDGIAPTQSPPSDVLPPADQPAWFDSVMRLVAVNTAYYRHQFARFGQPPEVKFALSWHWPAFFGFFFWAMYRKLWGWAAVHLVGSLAVVAMGLLHPLYLLWLFVWPCSANYLYFRHCLRHSSQAGGANAGGANVGGVSRAALWSSVFIFMIAWAVWFRLTWIETLEKLTQAYTQAEFSQLQRGDGSPVVSQPDAAREEQQTLAKMTLIVASLWFLSEQRKVAPADIAVYIERLSQAELLDGWRTPMRLRMQDTRITLQSAGADKRHGSDDDFLHIVLLTNPI